MSGKKNLSKKTKAKKATTKKSATKKTAAKRKSRTKKSATKKQAAQKVEVLEANAIDPKLIVAGPKTDSSTKGSKALAHVDPTTRYMAEIRKYPLLSREEEKALAIKYYETGDAQAAQQLVTANLRFVVKVASEYAKFGARLIDLIQEGNMGLMHAVKEFNPYKGVKLITYAVWWIRGYIQEYMMRQYSMVRIGTTQNQRKLYYQLRKHKAELEQMGMDAGIKQLSGSLGIDEEQVKSMAQRMSGRDVSLNVPVDESGKTTLIDLQTDTGATNLDDQLGHAEELVLLDDRISELRPKLNPREMQILDERLLSDEPKTLQEIADQYGVTREAVRQMEVRVIDKLKKQMQG